MKHWKLISAICFLAIAASLIAFPLRPILKNRFLDAPLGKYSFIVYDKTGYKAAEGQLTITQFRHSAVIGDWRLKFYESNEPRFKSFSGQQGESEFTGRYEGKSISMNLNPISISNYDFLVGKFDDNKILGEYRFCSVNGCNPIGTFEAVRK